MDSFPISSRKGNALNNGTLFMPLGFVVVGGLFGYAAAFGLGLRTLPSLVVALIVGAGVYLTKSLPFYLLIQAIALSGFSGSSFVLFLINPSFSISPEFFQITYAAIVVISPLVATALPKVRTIYTNLSAPFSLQLSGSILFFLLVHFLKISRPSNPLFALGQMYPAEDNAGVINVLRQSLEVGYANHVSKFGEFMNAIYLAAAGQITWFGDQNNSGLVAALTHFNLTTLFMAWIPISVLFTIFLSGKNLKGIEASISLGILSGALILLLWPFVNYGHTSAITTSLFAMPLVAIFLNRNLAQNYPIVFTLIVTVLASITGSTWFPLAPFAAATVAIAISFLGWIQYKKGKRKTVIGLVIIGVILGLIQLPTVIDLARNDSYYLQLFGGTRSAGDLLVLIWLGLAALSIWLTSKSEKKSTLPVHLLFGLVVFTLLASVLYIFIAGIAANGGSPGYGASKYLLIVISLSLPVFFLSLIEKETYNGIVRALTIGIILALAIVFTQADTRNVASAFITLQSAADLETSKSGIVIAIQKALDQDPDHVLCVSDFGYPAPGEDIRPESYFCTRWAQSLVGGDSESSGWGFVPLNRQEVSYMNQVVDSYKKKSVVIIRFIDPANPKLVQDTWWSEYVDKSWKIINVG